MSDTKKIKFAVVGAGHIGKRHAEMITRNDESELVALVDIVLVTISLYWLLLIISGTTAMTVLRGAGLFIVLVFLVSRIFELTVLKK